MTATPQSIARHVRALERQVDRRTPPAPPDPFPIDHLETWEADLLADHLARHRREGGAYFDALTREEWSAAQYIVGRMMRPTRPVDPRHRSARADA